MRSWAIAPLCALVLAAVAGPVSGTTGGTLLSVVGGPLSGTNQTLMVADTATGLPAAGRAPLLQLFTEETPCGLMGTMPLSYDAATRTVFLAGICASSPQAAAAAIDARRRRLLNHDSSDNSEPSVSGPGFGTSELLIVSVPEEASLAASPGAQPHKEKKASLLSRVALPPGPAFGSGVATYYDAPRKRLLVVTFPAKDEGKGYVVRSVSLAAGPSQPGPLEALWTLPPMAHGFTLTGLNGALADDTLVTGLQDQAGNFLTASVALDAPKGTAAAVHNLTTGANCSLQVFARNSDKAALALRVCQRTQSQRGDSELVALNAPDWSQPTTVATYPAKLSLYFIVGGAGSQVISGSHSSSGTPGTIYASVGAGTIGAGFAAIDPATGKLLAAVPYPEGKQPAALVWIPWTA